MKDLEERMKEEAKNNKRNIGNILRKMILRV